MKAAIHKGRVSVVSMPCPWQLSPWSGSEAGSLCSEHDFPVFTLSSTLWATFSKLPSIWALALWQRKWRMNSLVSVKIQGLTSHFLLQSVCRKRPGALGRPWLRALQVWVGGGPSLCVVAGGGLSCVLLLVVACLCVVLPVVARLCVWLLWAALGSHGQEECQREEGSPPSQPSNPLKIPRKGSENWLYHRNICRKTFLFYLGAVRMRIFLSFQKRPDNPK